MNLTQTHRSLSLGMLVLFGLLSLGCQKPATPATVAVTKPAVLSPIVAASSEKVHEFCGSCHAYVPPEYFPKRDWDFEVKRGFKFFEHSGKRNVAPSLESVIKYYEDRAPDELPPIVKGKPIDKSPFSFLRQGYRDEMRTKVPAISNVRLTNRFGTKKPDVLFCEMFRGEVYRLRLDDPEPRPELLSKAVSHPAHVEVVDLDGDGIQDLIVANLGNFLPTNEPVGGVYWLRGTADGKFTPIQLLSGVGRVCDVQVADFNGDGKPDLVVAAFGWLDIGNFIYLENRTTDYREPKFVPKVLDDRHGAVNIQIVDLNGDGKLDIVTVISQEHEQVIAFLGNGDGTFEKKVIYTAPHAAFGSSGVQVVDLNGDGKLDVLYTNGDTLDRILLRPYHGIHWLENRGEFPFTEHLIANMYGVHRALPADFDGDGKLDIVAVGFLPEPGCAKLREQADPEAILVLRQTEPGKFERYYLETMTSDHATCDVGDVDGDGRPDIVTANFSLLADEPSRGPNPTNPRSSDWIVVYRNMKK